MIWGGKQTGFKLDDIHLSITLSGVRKRRTDRKRGGRVEGWLAAVDNGMVGPMCFVIAVFGSTRALNADRGHLGFMRDQGTSSSRSSGGYHFRYDQLRAFLTYYAIAECLLGSVWTPTKRAISLPSNVIWNPRASVTPPDSHKKGLNHAADRVSGGAASQFKSSIVQTNGMARLPVPTSMIR